MRGWVLGAICALCLLGCGEEEAAPRPSTRGRPPSVDPPPAPPAPAPAPQPPKPAFTEPFPFEQPTPAAAPTAAAKPSTQPVKERVYGAELLAQLSGSQSCVQPRPTTETLPVEAVVDIEAHVLESGIVSRGYARSSYLNADELKCIERRVESARLPGDVKEAPRRVDTQIKLSFPRAPAPAPAPGAPGAPAPAAPGSPPSY
jgi:hypothetical protein